MSQKSILFLVSILFSITVLSVIVRADDLDKERKIIDPEVEGINLKAILPTPVYSISNIPSLYYDYSTFKPSLKLDDKGHMRELEFIALNGTKFILKKQYKFGRIRVYEVKTDDYPSRTPLYIDSNFVVRCFKDDMDRDKTMPSKQEILSAMKSMVGKPYRWGGNFSKGIKEQLNFYPLGEINNLEEFLNKNKSAWILEGVDCSGMLYEASNGTTPRNTSDLVTYGNAVEIEGLSVEQVISKLKPLDLIVWNGHVVIVYDNKRTIESRPRYPDGHKGGVRMLPLKERIEDIMKTRIPVNQYYPSSDKNKRFVVRRFID